MATVTGLTAERMIEMEQATVIEGHVSGGDLILVTRGGTEVNAGYVAGPAGPSGGAFTICTSTTRPTVTNEGLAIYETDTKLVRIWTGTRWRLQERIVCTSTTRPAVVVADEGVRIYQTDNDLEYSWTGTRWKLQERIVCTSTTRPTGLIAADEGVKIYETDSGLEFIWTGTVWSLATMTASGVPKYADAAERLSQYPAPADGALSYLSNSPGSLWVFTNGVWNTIGDPPGTCKPWLSNTPPLYHVLMYGQTITGAQALYPLLWANVDSLWKSGSSLIVPDMRGRIPAGKDNMGGASANRLTSPVNGASQGAAGGNQSMQSHSHGVIDPGHYHNVGETLSGAGSFGVVSGGKAIKTETFGSVTHISLTENGSGDSQNVQPTIVLNWILKVV